MASQVAVECAACHGGAVKCWRCTPSAPRGALSGSDSSGSGRDAVAAARARSRRAPRPAVSSDGSSDPMPPHDRAPHRQSARTQRSNGGTSPTTKTGDDDAKRGGGRRRAERGGSSSGGSRSDSGSDRREADRALARYVPDDETRARALAAMTPLARSARDWYNARASEAHASSSSLSFNDSMSSSSSSSSSPSSSSSSWAHVDPVRDVRGAINFCKSVLIGRYVQPRCAVMDLGCGRGQDVAKLAYARPRFVLFVDASESALAEAERRWRRTRFAFPAAFVQDDFCSAAGLLAGRRVVVHRDDPQRAPGQRHHAVPDAECVVPEGADLVDAVSCQFAAQHAFATRETARTFVANVRRALRPGGVFVGIVADGARLWELSARRALDAPAVEAEDDAATRADGNHDADDGDERLRRVVLVMSDAAPGDAEADGTRAPDPGNAVRSHVACAMGVRAQGTPCPQYTAVFDDLHAMCVDAGLVPMASCNLATFFDIESINPRNAPMLERMGAPLRIDDADDREHMGLYRVFAFVRADRAPAPVRLMTPTAPDQDGAARRAAGRPRPSGRALSYVWSSDIAST